jgi:hypothetical protein
MLVGKLFQAEGILEPDLKMSGLGDGSSSSIGVSVIGMRQDVLDQVIHATGKLVGCNQVFYVMTLGRPHVARHVIMGNRRKAGRTNVAFVVVNCLTLAGKDSLGQHDSLFVVGFRRMKGALVVYVSHEMIGMILRLTILP